MNRRGGGYSLTELMVCVAILIIFGGISIGMGIEGWQNEQSNAIAVELSGWLANVQRAALRGRRCDVILAPSANPIAGSSIAATAAEAGGATLPNGCLSFTPLRISSVSSATRFSLTPRNLTFSYTPRGTIANASADPLTLTITLEQGGTPHCVRIEGILGLTRIGQVTGGVCQVPS